MLGDHDAHVMEAQLVQIEGCRMLLEALRAPVPQCTPRQQLARVRAVELLRQAAGILQKRDPVIDVDRVIELCVAACDEVTP